MNGKHTNNRIQTADYFKINFIFQYWTMLQNKEKMGITKINVQKNIGIYFT